LYTTSVLGNKYTNHANHCKPTPTIAKTPQTTANQTKPNQTKPNQTNQENKVPAKIDIMSTQKIRPNCHEFKKQATFLKNAY
jgi:hypothetical protein